MKNTLHIKNESIELHPDRPSTGNIYFQFGEVYFPEKDWNDFVDVILNWWMSELLTFETTKKGTFRFMDGPFEIHFAQEPKDQNVLNLTLKGLDTKNIQVDKEVFLWKMKREIRALIEYLSVNQLKNNEFEKLKLNLGKLIPRLE